ncbi:MAG: class I SAM-dependent methyltransferase [Deltaproteobacteria bacterium]|nr:class I SAM-dependent methyltransferase [Deltaproteobacteria bacterium]
MASRRGVKHELGTPEGKRLYNERHFSEAASRYDIGTKLLSLGLDSYWKRTLVSALPLLAEPICIDLACGTGDIAFLLAKKYPQGQILGLDITPRMLEVANKRNSFKNVKFEQQDIGDLKVKKGTADIITASYAIRNAPDLAETLRQIHNILKPGGTAAFLDFAKPVNRCLQVMQYWLLRFWGSLWGIILHGDPQIHGYISDSLPAYLDTRALGKLLEQTGFQVVKRRRFLLGMMEMIVLTKFGGS